MKTTTKVGRYFDPSFETAELDYIQDTLEAGADEVTEGKYTKRLNPQEINEAQKQFAYLNIEKAEIKAEMDAYVKTKKAEIKLLEEEAAAELEKVKTKTQFVEGKLYHYNMQEEGERVTYDDTGLCTDVRPLRREERQTSVFSITDKSNGTHGK